MEEKKVLGILAIVFGGVGLALSWVPIINNMAFVLALVGVVLGVIALIINRKAKKLLALIGTIISVLALVIVLVTQSSYSKAIDDAFKGSSSSSTTSSSTKTKAEHATNKASNDTTDPSKRPWTFKNNVYAAGILTYKFTKSEVRDSVTDGKKVLVILADVTNNTDKEQDPSNIYMVMHAFQKTATANKDLEPGILKSDDNLQTPFQAETDALNDKLLGKKTTTVAISFELENDSPVTVKFDNPDFQTIGEKTYDVK